MVQPGRDRGFGRAAGNMICGASVEDKSRASEQDIETGPRKKRNGLKQIA
jgi:hypothetical protein